MELRLLVIRTPNTQRLADFYSLLGLNFEQHKHGNGPAHFAAPLGTGVLEIYPLAKGQEKADPNLRLGFRVPDFEEVVERLNTSAAEFFRQPGETEFGFMAVVVDPDGRKVELYR